MLFNSKSKCKIQITDILNYKLSGKLIEIRNTITVIKNYATIDCCKY